MAVTEGWPGTGFGRMRARATAALPHAAAREARRRFPGTTSTGPFCRKPGAGCAAGGGTGTCWCARGGRCLCHAHWRRRSDSSLLGRRLRGRGLLLRHCDGGLEKLAVRECWPGPRFARIRADDGGVTARRRPRDAAAHFPPGHNKHGLNSFTLNFDFNWNCRFKWIPSFNRIPS